MIAGCSVATEGIVAVAVVVAGAVVGAGDTESFGAYFWLIL